MHAFVYVSVNAGLVFVWLVTTGSTKQLEAYIRHPLDSVQDGFWPGVVIVFWGVGLVIHAGAAITREFPSQRAKRHRQREKREAHEAERKEQKRLKREHQDPRPQQPPKPQQPRGRRGRGRWWSSPTSPVARR